MGRPKRVVYENFHLYDKLHTKKTRMYSGVEMTTLYPIKETAEYYMSIEVWAFCASKFRMKKDRCTLHVDIPVITDQRAIDFLDEHCWEDWADRESGNAKDSEMRETICLLNRLFPDKKKIFFYELESILAAYCNGSFVSYDQSGAEEPLSSNAISNLKYYNQKYQRDLGMDDPGVKRAYEAYQANSKSSDEVRQKYYNTYSDLQRDYAYEHNNLRDVFVEIGRNSVCYPVAYSRGTAEWSKKKYGKEIAYARAGEIFFVTTEDRVYFEVKRHF